MDATGTPPLRLAIVMSHPVQYYVPLYQRLSQREDVEIKVFYTWHAGETAVFDHGFEQDIAWDIPLREGYAFEAVPNTSANPGTHHFNGLVNPHLRERVMRWKPDAVHITGWAWRSHLSLMRTLSLAGVPVLFRGDSHLLDPQGSWWRVKAKRLVLRRVFSWPRAVLYTGQANRAYFEAFGVRPERLHRCPHSVDVARFARSAAELEAQAGQWRRELGFGAEQKVILFAAKLEPRKQPLELMRAVAGDAGYSLIMVGGGELLPQAQALAATAPHRIRLLPFQNQSRMPLVYRLGDVFVMPSARGETWGLAVNEALACGRPVAISDRVGCGPDVVDASCGRTFPADDQSAMMRAIDALAKGPADPAALRSAATDRAWSFDIRETESTLVRALKLVCHAQ